MIAFGHFQQLLREGPGDLQPGRGREGGAFPCLPSLSSSCHFFGRQACSYLLLPAFRPAEWP